MWVPVHRVPDDRVNADDSLYACLSCMLTLCECRYLVAGFLLTGYMRGTHSGPACPVLLKLAMYCNVM